MLVDAYRGEFGMIDMSYARFALSRATARSSPWSTPQATSPHSRLGPPHGNRRPRARLQHSCIQAHMARAPAHTVPQATLPASAQHCQRARHRHRQGPHYMPTRAEPISIAGRWDLNRAHRSSPLPAPTGSTTQRFGTEEIKAVLAGLTMKPQSTAPALLSRMKFGSPYIDGTPSYGAAAAGLASNSPEEGSTASPTPSTALWNKVKMFME